MIIQGAEYHVTLTGSGQPLLLLHGFTGSSASWAEHIPWLSGHFQVITVDLLGHGRSGSPADPARYAMARAADDLRAALKVCGVEAPVMLGYSMGGRLALYYALRHPVRALILESASPGLANAAEREARKAADEALADRIDAEGIGAFVDFWEAQPLFATQAALPEAKRAAVRAARLACNPAGLANSLRGMGTGVQPDLWGKLISLEAPALLICGALDEKFTTIAREMAKRMRSGRVEVVAQAGHAVHLEQPLAWRDALLRFVRDVSRRRMA